MRRTTVTAAAIAAGLAILLTGCVNPLQAAVEKAAEEAGIQVDEDNGTVRIESEDGTLHAGGEVEVPADFPADVPLPGGKPVSAMSTGEGWALAYEKVDRAGVEQLIAELESRGFTTALAVDQPDAIQRGFENGSMTVSIIWSAESDGSLVYGVTLH